VRGKIGGPVVFSGRLSRALPWTITVKSPSGSVAAKSSGIGSAIAWTWNSAGVKPGRYTWTMEAGPSTLPARGIVGANSLPIPSGPLLTSLAITPGTVSPNGDGWADTNTITYSLAGKATVTATVTDSNGTVFTTAFTGQKQQAGPVSLAWSPDALVDGAYKLVVSAVGDDGRTGKATAPFLVDRVLGFVTATPAVVTPNGDGIDDTVSVDFALAGTGDVTVSILASDGSPVASLYSGLLEPGSQAFVWNGLATDGTAVPPGTYQAVVDVTDSLGTVIQSATFDIALPPS
jgi:flagellar hook assembly protein FlgD